MKTALLEISVENLPAKVINPALRQMKILAEKMLSEQNISYDNIKTLGTYKRLSLLIEGLPEKAKDITKEVSGPPAHLLKDDKGNFTPQSEGFAKKSGVEPKDLTVIETKKGKFLSAKQTIKGKKAKEILTEIFPLIIKNLHFPKTMVWEENKFKFARPIRSIAALYGADIISFTLAGVKTSNTTFGLSALGSAEIKIENAENYENILKKQGIAAFYEQRKETLLTELNNEAKKADCKLLENKTLLEETVFLTEKTKAVLCKFDENFLNLPPELIKTVFANHMKCFALERNSKTAPYFIAVLDGVEENLPKIAEGYENVATARLADADFFYEKDLKSNIEKMKDGLKGILFNEKIGAMADKTERIEKICGIIYEENLKHQFKELNFSAVRDISKYCYADLTSQVVGEFAELQGYMGSVYAAKTGLDGKTIKGLQEFYYPLTSEAPLPSTLEGSLVSLADKLDTLACNFSLGNIPTGSEDPHGLRRQAMGAVRIIIEKNFNIGKLPLLIGKIFQMIHKEYKEIDLKNLTFLLMDFFWQRLENYFEEKGYSFDEIRAVKEKMVKTNFSLPLTDLSKRLDALKTVRKDKDFNDLSVSFKRTANILKKITENFSIDKDLLKEPQEKNLFNKINDIKPKQDDFLKKQDYISYLKNLIALKPFIDSFFDSVMVMDKDEKIKQNRLALLQEIYTLFTSIADLSQLQ